MLLYFISRGRVKKLQLFFVDMIFCIRRDAVDVYCNPINIHYLTPYITHWRNLRLHCMKEADVRRFFCLHQNRSKNVQRKKSRSYFLLFASTGVDEVALVP